MGTLPFFVYNFNNAFGHGSRLRRMIAPWRERGGNSSIDRVRQSLLLRHQNRGGYFFFWFLGPRTYVGRLALTFGVFLASCLQSLVPFNSSALGVSRWLGFASFFSRECISCYEAFYLSCSLALWTLPSRVAHHSIISHLIMASLFRCDLFVPRLLSCWC